MRRTHREFKVPSDHDWNPDVPLETLLRHTVNENRALRMRIGELESEILYLRDIISRREKAISDFKQWQGNVARMQVDEWVALAESRASLPPDVIELYNKLRQVLHNKTLFESQVRRLDIVYKNYQNMMENRKDEQRGIQETDY